jgi:hypothetical protein
MTNNQPIDPGQVWRHLRGFPVTVERLTPRKDACWIRYGNGGVRMLWLSELRNRYRLEPQAGRGVVDRMEPRP